MPDSVTQDSAANDEAITRITHQKIEAINKYYPQIAHTIEEALFKELKCRSKYDNMAKKMTEYADAESKGIRTAFTNTADLLRRVQEYRVTYTRTVRQRVQVKLGEYTAKCKDIEALVKKYESVLTVKKKKHSAWKEKEAASSSVKKASSISKAQTAFTEANTAMVQQRAELLEQMQTFEKDKLKDLKGMLRYFIQAQMWYYSRGLETLSRAYEEIDGIDEEEDMREFNTLQKAAKLVAEADNAATPEKGKKILALTARSPTPEPGDEHHTESGSGSGSSSDEHTDN